MPAMPAAKATPADSWQEIHIHRGAPPKPPLGRPCNGCGQCCLLEPCPLGMVVSLKRSGACTALRWDDAGLLYRCGLLAEPAAVLGRRWAWATPLVRRLARRWISAGSGCDAEINALDNINPSV